MKHLGPAVHCKPSCSRSALLNRCLYYLLVALTPGAPTPHVKRRDIAQAKRSFFLHFAKCSAKFCHYFELNFACYVKQAKTESTLCPEFGLLTQQLPSLHLLESTRIRGTQRRGCAYWFTCFITPISMLQSLHKHDELID